MALLKKASQVWFANLTRLRGPSPVRGLLGTGPHSGVRSRVSEGNLSCVCSRSRSAHHPPSSSPCQSSSRLDSGRSRNPPVDCTGEGSQLVTPYKSVQFSRSVVSNSLRLPGLQHPGLPVHHPLPEFTQTHAHQVGDAIQPSHPLSSPSPPAPNPSQHHGLFQ